VAAHLGQNIPACSRPLLFEDRPLVEQDFLEQAPFHFKWKE
jgi:hypothetical protein